ncbi:MAG: helix-turn-helix domain-containing protein [Cyclobacteriaceae bacterium]
MSLLIENSINISYQLSDSAILEVLGTFIRETRLRQNKTQEDVAIAAGIQRMTLVRIEKGSGGTMATLIRLLRCLEQFHVLNQFLLPAQISPMKLAKLEQRKRHRARPKKRSGKDKRNDKQSDW